jgi:hypothetical protein
MVGPPRRRPFPYDMVISNAGVMLGHKTQPNDGDGPAPLVGAKVQPFLSTAPTDYQYDTQPPLFERVQAYNDLTLGYGLRKQGAYQDKKYRYAQGVDCSIDGQFIKGPALTTFTPATTDATRDGYGDFFEIGGILHCALGRYILRRASDISWTVVKDFGASAYVLHAEVFASTGTGTVLVWAAMSGTNSQWSTDGATWVAADGTAGKPNQTALAYKQVGNEFWMGSDINQLSKCDTDSDPTLAINWTNANSFRVGDKTSPINSLVVSAVGSLLALKTDGVYTLDDAGVQHQLFASVAQGAASDTENGRYSGSFGNDTHMTYGHSHLRAVPTVSFGTPRLEMDEVGPEKLTENDSPVTGRVTTFCGDSAKAAYAGLYDDDTGNSYLLRFGSWIGPQLTAGTLDEGKRIDSWHGALDAPFANGALQFGGKKITLMTRSPRGASAGHYRIYGACSDGSLFWFQLPCTPNPLGCSAYLYTTLDSYVYFPLWTGTFEVDAKVLRGVSVMSTLLTDSTHTNSMRFEYKIDPTVAAYTALGTTFATSIRQRVDFPNNVGVYLADMRAVLISAATTSTPQITAIALHHAVRPALLLTYDFRVLAADGLVKRNGAPIHTIGASQIRSVVKAAAAAIGSVTVILPDETVLQLNVVDYKESTAFDTRLRKWTASLDVTAVQYTVNTSYGTWGRVAAYKWIDLLPYTWGQVAGL